MGFSLPMSLPKHSFLRRLIGAFAAAFIATMSAQAWAQAAIETYTNQAVPPAASEGVLPEGMEWNKPLKAGTLVLPHPSKKKETAKAKKPEPKSLPVGELKAPQIQKPTSPPLLSSSKSSSASVQLMQGMKNALQQAGQSPDLPETSTNALTPDVAGAGESAALMPPLLSKDAEAGAPADTTVKYEPGRGPVDLATGKPPEGGLPSVDKSLAPSINIDGADASSPKATEIKDEPVSLDKAPSKLAEPLKPTKPEPKSRGLFGGIFGPPVDATEEEMASAPEFAKTEPAKATEPVKATEPAEKKTDAACEPKVMSWTKECKLAGYPSSYTGKITGETRTECPSGDIKDVWLSNTCAAPEMAKGEEPRATDMASAPKSLSDSDLTTPPPMQLGKAVPDAKSAWEPEPVTKTKPAAKTAAIVEKAEARVDANCGTANGSATDSKPVEELCAAGSPSEVSGEGPWRWSCLGANGGMTVSCAAPVSKTAAKTADKATGAAASEPGSAEDGKCGTADGTGADSAPTTDLCAKGIPSRVNGGGPWTWACSGTHGGQAAACSAPKKVDGACGSASVAGTDERPERNLCATGYASAVTGEGPWNWTCSGLYGGEAATCSASPKVNAVCGAASLSGHRSMPTSGLCKVGEASAVEGEGPWTWTCAGEQGGATVKCRAATMVDGVCGGANGQSFTSAPKDDLCAQGTATRVTGLGPWDWNCSGLEGGSTVSCTAALGGKEANVSGKKAACGAAAEKAASQAPVANLCAGGRASAVNGQGPWTWSCTDDDGHDVACTANVATEGACGTAANVASAESPAADLCASGTPGIVTADKGKKNWSWTCKGSLGAATVSCSAPVLQKAAEDAKCGPADGRGASKAPTTGLCDAGKAVAVKGSGPWTWQCAAKSGRKVNCEAPKVSDGACGPANGSIQKALPLTGLCAAGTPTEVDGTGPWLWSCVGTGGGSSVSCSAAAQSQAKVDGGCGAAANAVMTSAPEANLCDSGVPSAVNGEGPWTWTCSGLNGGIASTCTTSKVMPKAPPPPGPPVDANCGPANGVAAVHHPVEGLCSSGTATNVSGNGPWNWNCLGANGGMTVSCTAPLMPPAPIEGVCGPANGVTTLVAPKSGLCSAGISSAVSGKGPWTWSCSGTNGGGAVSCVAPLAGKGGAATGPIPTPVTPSAVYDASDDAVAPAPKAAPVGLVTPRLPAGPLPPLESGSLPQLKPSAPLERPLEASQMPQKSFPQPQVIDENETLPSGQKALTSPPIRDTVKPKPSLKPPAIDEEGKPVPGSHVELDSDMATLSFDRGSDNLSGSTMASLDKLAALLKQKVAVRITLNAYAATTGEITPREARRISLSRALAIRDYLTNKGISSSRIDVRALGANVPSGDMDRVDVKVN